MPAVSCNNCNKKFSAPETAIGKTARCPACSSPIQIQADCSPNLQGLFSKIRSNSSAQEQPPTAQASPNAASSTPPIIQAVPSPALPIALTCLWLVLEGIGIATGRASLPAGTLFFYGTHGDIACFAYLVAFPVMIVALVGNVIFIRKAWAVLPEETRKRSMGSKAGLLFVPLFNYLWAFPAIAGLARETNLELKSKGHAPRVAEQLAVAACCAFAAYGVLSLFNINANFGALALSIAAVPFLMWMVSQADAIALLVGDRAAQDRPQKLWLPAVYCSAALLAVLSLYTMNQRSTLNPSISTDENRGGTGIGTAETVRATGRVCFTCQGTGHCFRCRGTGKLNLAPSTALVHCDSCYGKGTCAQCDGSGKSH